MTTRLIALIAAALVVTADAAHAQNGRPFRKLQEQITTLSAKVASIETRTATSLSAIDAQLATLSAQVAANTASIEQLRVYDALVDERVAALGGAVLAMQSAMTGVQTTVDALARHNALMEDWRAALEARWHEADARLAANTADIQRLVEADRALQEYVAALRLDLEFARTAAADASASASQTRLLLTALQSQLREKQNLIRGVCPVGSAIRQVAADGTVACEFDDAGGAAGGVQTADAWTTLVRTPANGFGYGYAYCPTGFVPTGGGFSVNQPLYVFHNGPLASMGWVVAASNPSAADVSFHAFGRCLRP